MAVNISTGHLHATPRPPLMRRRGPEHEGTLAAFMVALVVVGVAIWALAAPGGYVSLPSQLLQLVRASEAPISRPTDGVVPAPAPIVPAAADPADASIVTAATDTLSVDTAVSTPALAVGKQARVVNTEGQGVVLHAAPQAGARRPSGLLEGVTVTVLELRGEDWARVQSSSRQAGWVPVTYLAPAS